jgi:hypothetical protein
LWNRCNNAAFCFYFFALSCQNALMNLDQIRAAAERQSCYLNDPSHTKIRVASSVADSNADQICVLLQIAIIQFGLPAKIVRTGSFGFYDFEPLMILGSLLYNNANPDCVADLVNELII